MIARNKSSLPQNGSIWQMKPCKEKWADHQGNGVILCQERWWARHPPQRFLTSPGWIQNMPPIVWGESDGWKFSSSLAWMCFVWWIFYGLRILRHGIQSPTTLNHHLGEYVFKNFPFSKHPVASQQANHANPSLKDDFGLMGDWGIGKHMRCLL